MDGLNGLRPTLKLLLKVLFRLKYLEGLGEREISDALGIPPFIVERFSRKLEECLKSKLGEVSAETLKSLCPECLEPRVRFDPVSSEYVCSNCGLVVDAEGYDLSLSFDTTYALTSELAYGKSLGGTLGYQGIVRVLAKSPSTAELAKLGNAHLGTRARIAQIIMETVEPQPIRDALRKARDLSLKYGFQNEYVFNNHVGILVKRSYIFSHYLAGTPTFKHRLAETCFWMALRKFGKANLACRFLEENKVNHALAVALEELQSFLDDVSRRGRIRGKVLQAHPMLALVDA